MDLRLTVGTLVCFCYNEIIGRLPSRRLRKTFLKSYLGGVGNESAVQMHCRFLNGRKVFLGERNIINFGCLLDGRKHEIRIGNDVAIGPEATILTLGHDPQSPDFASRGGPVFIGDRAWIAYRAIVLPGVEIGEGAVVGAGSVVSRDVAPYTIVAGNPAKYVKDRQRNLTYRSAHAPWLR